MISIWADAKAAREEKSRKEDMVADVLVVDINQRRPDETLWRQLTGVNVWKQRTKFLGSCKKGPRHCGIRLLKYKGMRK
jgi:hypothetical protein